MNEQVKKIKAEIERRKGYISVTHFVEDLLSFIDSLPDENNPEPYNPVYDEDYLNEKIAKATKSWEGVDVNKMITDCRGYDEQPSEDLENEIEKASKRFPEVSYAKLARIAKRFFIIGAEWQKEQFEKNRLAACDNQTREEYERETDFATSIIEKEHRQPTFSDAINYGMHLQKEKLYNDAIECLVCAGKEGDKWIMTYIGSYESMLQTCKAGDKVKIIIVKEHQH